MAQLVIAGAGAAGLFAAACAAQNGHSVTLVEHMPKPGRKLAITGKGRCNITNECTQDEFLKNVRRNPRFLYSAINGFTPQDAMQWFEQRGLELKVERGRRVFPRSDRAEDVVNTLLQACSGVRMVRGRAAQILLQDGRAVGLKLADGSEVAADAVLVATGGVSYPKTGSTGDGYKMAKKVGHSIVPPQASLVSMVEKGRVAAQMAGLSLRNVRLVLREDGREVYSEQGEMLFTHFGISGPLVLSASAYLEDMKAHSYTVALDLKPALDAQQLDARLQRDFALFANKHVKNSLDKLLPQSMREPMVRRWGVDPMQKVNQVTKEQRRQLIELVKSFEIDIKERGSLEHAVVVSGGVNVKEIEPKTMQSRIVQGLYFAGEVLDVDAYTGGYNLQIAWATAHAAVSAL